MRALALMVLVVLPTLAPLPPTLEPEATPAWRAKADPRLLEAFDDGDHRLRIQIAGPRVPIEPGAFATRQDWRAHFEEVTGPFRQALRERIEALGGDVRQEVRYANALFAVVPRDAVPRLLAPADVRQAALDEDGAVRLLDGEPGAPGARVDLGETIAKLQAQDLWARGYRGEGVLLAGIDTGVRHTHELLKRADGSSRVVGWYDATGPAGTCSTPCDTHGHGTHTLTTAAGSNAFNPAAPQGMAPGVSLLGIRAFQGSTGSFEDAQEALQAAFDLGADITTNSWGGDCAGARTTAELVEDLQALGMMSVFAAGNSGPGAGTVDCPGRVESVLTVGSVDLGETVATSSSRGPCTWPVGSGTTFVCPDVLAVGVDVTAGCHASDTHYCTKSGTSMATPHVAGAVVLLEQASRDLRGRGLDATRKEAELFLRYTAQDLGPLGPDHDYGWGLAKALEAFRVLEASPPVALHDRFAVGRPILRAYEANPLTFRVVNLGTESASGTLQYQVDQLTWGSCPPTCESLVLHEGPLDLAPLSETTLNHTFLGADHPPGTYRVTARVDYTFIDPVDGQRKGGSLERTGTFELRKVVLVETHRIPPELSSGEAVQGGFALVNVGNERAGELELQQVFPATGLAPLPLVPPATGSFGAFADPSPRLVEPLAQGSSVVYRYRWDIGEIGPLDTWETAYNMLGAAPGEAHAIRSVLEYEDETGQAFVEERLYPVMVRAPGWS